MNRSTKYDYGKWLRRETPADWAETTTPERFIETSSHMFLIKTNRWEKNLYNTLYRWQHVYKRLQNDFKDKFPER